MALRAPSKRPPWTACTPGAAAEEEDEEAAEPVDDAVESAVLLEPAVVELAVEVALPEALRVVLAMRTTPVPMGYEVELPAGKKVLGACVVVLEETCAATVGTETVGTADELA